MSPYTFLFQNTADSIVNSINNQISRKLWIIIISPKNTSPSKDGRPRGAEPSKLPLISTLGIITDHVDSRELMVLYFIPRL
eukprot:UN01740